MLLGAEIYPLQVLLPTVSGWVNRHQADVIAYLLEENRVLKKQLKGRRLRLTDDQRRRLTSKAKILGRRALDHVATIVTPDTLMPWYRRLIAWKWIYQAKRVGRPGLMAAIKALIVRMARENSKWGSCRIQGELKKLGHEVSSTTVANGLKENGIRPGPERPSSWRSFLRAHWGQIAAMDFFATEVWTLRGLKTYHVLFVVHLKGRRDQLAELKTNPDGSFMGQVARNLTDMLDGFLLGHRFVICDRDDKITRWFKRTLEGTGVRTILTPFQAPNANADAERFVPWIKSECLEQMVFFGRGPLRHAIDQYLQHYHMEWAHQGLGNTVIEPGVVGSGGVACHERLGGILKHYYRAA